MFETGNCIDKIDFYFTNETKFLTSNKCLNFNKFLMLLKTIKINFISL